MTNLPLTPPSSSPQPTSPISSSQSQASQEPSGGKRQTGILASIARFLHFPWTFGKKESSKEKTPTEIAALLTSAFSSSDYFKTDISHSVPATYLTRIQNLDGKILKQHLFPTLQTASPKVKNELADAFFSKNYDPVTAISLLLTQLSPPPLLTPCFSGSVLSSISKEDCNNVLQQLQTNIDIQSQFSLEDASVQKLVVRGFAYDPKTTVEALKKAASEQALGQALFAIKDNDGKTLFDKEPSLSLFKMHLNTFSDKASKKAASEKALYQALSTIKDNDGKTLFDKELSLSLFKMHLNTFAEARDDSRIQERINTLEGISLPSIQAFLQLPPEIQKLLIYGLLHFPEIAEILKTDLTNVPQELILLKDPNKDTLLHHATREVMNPVNETAKERALEHARLLLKLGADPAQKNNQENTFYKKLHKTHPILQEKTTLPSDSFQKIQGNPFTSEQQKGILERVSSVTFAQLKEFEELNETEKALFFFGLHVDKEIDFLLDYKNLEQLVNTADTEGNTLLHLAIKKDPKNILVAELLTMGGDITLKNQQGETPCSLIPANPAFLNRKCTPAPFFQRIYDSLNWSAEIKEKINKEIRTLNFISVAALRSLTTLSSDVQQCLLLGLAVNPQKTKELLSQTWQNSQDLIAALRSLKDPQQSNSLRSYAAKYSIENLRLLLFDPSLFTNSTPPPTSQNVLPSPPSTSLPQTPLSPQPASIQPTKHDTKTATALTKALVNDKNKKHLSLDESDFSKAIPKTVSLSPEDEQRITQCLATFTHLTTEKLQNLPLPVREVLLLALLYAEKLPHDALSFLKEKTTLSKEIIIPYLAKLPLKDNNTFLHYAALHQLNEAAQLLLPESVPTMNGSGKFAGSYRDPKETNELETIFLKKIEISSKKKKLFQTKMKKESLYTEIKNNTPFDKIPPGINVQFFEKSTEAACQLILLGLLYDDSNPNVTLQWLSQAKPNLTELAKYLSTNEIFNTKAEAFGFTDAETMLKAAAELKKLQENRT